MNQELLAEYAKDAVLAYYVNQESEYFHTAMRDLQQYLSETDAEFCERVVELTGEES
jgi:hypothetical protein